MVNTITDWQVDLINRLQEERQETEQTEAFLTALRSSYRKGEATTKHASLVITVLLEAPKKTAFSPGIYEDEAGHLFRVYLGQNSGRMLCKSINVQDKNLSYEYVGRADQHLQGTRRLTRQEVAERTLAYGSTSCMICGRRLDDPESVDRGVGPVCWENYA